MRANKISQNSTWWAIAVILAVGTIALALLVARDRDETVRGQVPEDAPVVAMRIPVEGMTCAVCAARVTSALRSVKGVVGAEVDLQRREAEVRYVKGQVSPERLVAVIDRLGYKAGAPVERAPQ